MTSEISPDWVPKHLRKTVGGQVVGLTPLHCEPDNGSGDHCMHCGRDLYKEVASNVCPALERLRLELVPDDIVAAFGCDFEAFCIQNHISGESRCDKWCHSELCPFTLREPAP